MVSYKYDIYELLEFIKGKDVHEVLLLLQQESYEATCRVAPNRRGTPKARELGCDRYENEIGALIWFLNNGAKPSGIFDNLFYAFVGTALTLTGYKQVFYDICNKYLQK